MAEVLVFTLFVAGVVALSIFVTVWAAKASQKTRRSFGTLAEVHTQTAH